VIVGENSGICLAGEALLAKQLGIGVATASRIVQEAGEGGSKNRW
jgi:hypothetical protein